MTNFLSAQMLLAACEQQERLDFHTREGLEAYQHRQMLYLWKYVLPDSPYYNLLLSKPVEHWPIMNIRSLNKYFNIINSVSVTTEAVQEAREKAYQGDFAQIGDYRIISGTENPDEKIFLINEEEQMQRIATLLTALKEPNQNHSRIAYCYRQNNLPIVDIEIDALSLKNYDLNLSYEEICKSFAEERIDTVIAPVSFLLRIHQDIKAGNLPLNITRVYNIGEVLTQRDRLKLKALFSYVGDIYQAAEGIIAMTCAYERMHLNEENFLIQKEYLEGSRFLPVITDFSAKTMPLVQYRLDDILIDDPNPCPCGRVSHVIKRVEGRLGDVLLLPGMERARVRLYTDYCHETLLKHLTPDNDYQLSQTAANTLHLNISGNEEILEKTYFALISDWKKRDVDTEKLIWQCDLQLNHQDILRKRRQIMRLF